jgi:uncharacterized protein (TIRG00374 family)
LKNLITGYLMAHRPWQKLGLLAALGVVVHLILPQITSLENSWQVLQTMIFWAVGFACVAQVLSYLGSGYLLQSILAISRQRASLWSSTLMVLGAASIGMVAGGMVGSSAAIYNWTSRSKGSPEAATLASILSPLFNDLMLVLVSIFGLIHLVLVHNLTQTQVIGFGFTLMILLIIMGSAALAVRYRNRATVVVIGIAIRLARLRRKPYDPENTRNFTNDLFNAWDTLWHGAWHKPALGAFLNVAFDMLTLYFLFVAAGENVSPGVLLAGYGLPLLLGKMAFIIPGGVGVVESSMAALYNGLGISQATIVVVVLGYRLFSFWIPSLVGFPIAAYLQRFKIGLMNRS